LLKAIAAVLLTGAVVAGVVWLILVNVLGGPCAEYRNAVTARQNDIDYNARLDRSLAENYITAEDHARSLKEIPPEPVEPEGGC
jgi:hypothetical protein